MVNQDPDYDQLVGIARRAVYLLQYRRSNSENARFRESSCYSLLDRQKLIHITSDRNQLGFDQYKLKDLQESLVDDSISLDLMTQFSYIIEQTNGESEEYDLSICFKSNWFKKFLNGILSEPYNLDRFILLTAIWIVGTECNHQSVPQLINELIDRIVHEEAASCSVEDLMLLSQPGSIWLTKYKLHQVTYLHKISTSTQKERASYQAETESSEDEIDVESTSSENDMFRSERAEIQLDVTLYGSINTKSKLRKIFNDEIIFGFRCQICSEHRSGVLLASLELDSCPTCTNLLSFEYCSISFRPLALTKLQSMNAFRPDLSFLYLISTPHWVRLILRAQKEIESKRTDSHDHGSIEDKTQNSRNERIDISENFQRLTVIRDEQEDDLISSERSSSFSSSDDENSMTNSGDPNHLDALLQFMIKRATTDQRKYQLTFDRPTESIEFLRSTQSNCREVSLNSGDILLLEDPSTLNNLNLIRITLVTSNVWRRFGQLYGCLLRSPLSQLQIGCGRLFSSLELAALGIISKEHSEGVCPCCSCDLTLVKSLASPRDLGQLMIDIENSDNLL